MSGEAAKKSLTKYQISADVARKLVDATPFACPFFLEGAD